MPEGKKDILDFPLEEVGVPQAIALMMQAASSRPTVGATCDEQENTYITVDDERLALLSEKLEARVEDELQKGVEPVLLESDNDPDIPLTESDIFLMEDGEILNHNGVIFQKACNKSVYYTADDGSSTTCIKRFGHHSPVHEDEFGNEAAAR